MYFYEYIHILSYIFTYCRLTSGNINLELRAVKSGLQNIVPSASGMKFYVIVNNTSDSNDFDVNLVPDQCCVDLGNKMDCDVIELIGNCVETIPTGSIKTLDLVAPILNPYERKGYCIAFLDSKVTQRKRKAMRNIIKIPFDTRLKKNKVAAPHGVEPCQNFDEDPLNDCKPVDCESFYNGIKPFYDVIRKRCVEVPHCVSEKGDVPSSVYDPISNKCQAKEAITKDDLEFIKGLTHKNGDRIVKDIVIIKKVDKSSDDFPSEQHKPHSKSMCPYLHKKHPPGPSIAKYLSKNKFIVIFLALLITFQCFVLCVMLGFSRRNCWCRKKNKIVKRYTGIKEEASVSTPLYDMANAGTSTTCQFMSESTHVGKKIQCYKACQKINPKLCMSDDILAKCVNRRNWDRNETKLDSVEQKYKCETKVDNSNAYNKLHISTVKEDQMTNESEKSKKRSSEISKGQESSKSEKQHEEKKKNKRIGKKADNKKTKGNKVKNKNTPADSERVLLCVNYDEDFNVENALSEKQLQYHSYNYGMECSDDDSIKSSSHRYSVEKNDKRQHLVYAAEVTKPKVTSTNKGQASAQASFSNDTIDDYLSERGMYFCENVSKYSFSDASLKSSLTSKTSKNNIIKHVLSYLKREKSGPSSDPGGKDEEEVNLELIHMSKATMYSSSNNENECVRTVSRVRDSRTSL